MNDRTQAYYLHPALAHVAFEYAVAPDDATHHERSQHPGEAAHMHP